MKAQILLAVLIVVSVAAYSQTKENTKNEHGAELSSVAKVKGDAPIHGETVSTLATLKAQGSADLNNSLLHRKDREKRPEKSELTGSEAGRHRQGISGSGIQKSAGMGVSARTGIQGKISRPGIRSNIRVNAGIRTF